MGKRSRAWRSLGSAAPLCSALPYRNQERDRKERKKRKETKARGCSLVHQALAQKPAAVLGMVPTCAQEPGIAVIIESTCGGSS